MVRANSDKDSPEKSINEEILRDKDKMVNLRPTSEFMAMYWGFDLSPPHFTYPNYSFK
jgi:hypothetical protein